MTVKSGGICGKPVIEPVRITQFHFEKIVIATLKWEKQIFDQCVKELNIKPAEIISLDEYIEYCAAKRERSPAAGLCNLCRSDVRVWLNTGQDNQTRYRIAGNGMRRSRCPHCGSTDRSRWVYYVLRRYTDIFNIGSEKAILHFAPEQQISNKIKSPRYYTGDIVKGRAGCQVDITDIPFRDSYFDYVIANHVMEHIPDEEKAVNELLRVTRDDGVIVLSFPICPDIDTLEQSGLCTEELREVFYGQSDHVRLYGRDYKERFEKYGLKVTVYSPGLLLGSSEIKEYNFIEEDAALLCRKAIL